jgi:hypothetical protein
VVLEFSVQGQGMHFPFNEQMGGGIPFMERYAGMTGMRNLSAIAQYKGMWKGKHQEEKEKKEGRKGGRET